MEIIEWDSQKNGNYTGKCEWHLRYVNRNYPIWTIGRKNIKEKSEYRALGAYGTIPEV